jgi:methylenetetrahydrofolate reductase (NADPH)
MNKGIYIEEEQVNTNPTDFSVGVAGYPEKHFEAPNMKADMQYLKEKVDAGADYIVTQMFFDNKKFFDFVDLCRAEGIKVPIIPGIKPITFLNDLHLLPQTFSIELPNELVTELKKCKDTPAARQVGVEWGILQARELKAAGVPVIHFYSLGLSENVRAIASEVF